eukprot:m51a1_g9090 hypothetical protein (200) ;mRNA; r:47952-48700
MSFSSVLSPALRFLRLLLLLVRTLLQLVLLLSFLLLLVAAASGSSSPTGAAAPAEKVYAVSVVCDKCSGGRVVVSVPASTTPHDLAVLAQAEAQKQGVYVPPRVLVPEGVINVGELVRISADLSIASHLFSQSWSWSSWSWSSPPVSVEFDHFKWYEEMSLTLADGLSLAGLSPQTASHVATVTTVTFWGGVLLHHLWK